MTAVQRAILRHAPVRQDPAIYRRRMAKALDRQGGLWTLDDLLARIKDGRMQSFACGNSWIVTQVSKYPQKRLLEIVCAVGDLGDCRRLHADVLAYAKELGVDLIAAYGRLGWMNDAQREGWKIKATSYLYHREL